MIFDYIHREWVKRKCPYTTCFNILNSSLYSGGENGKIYKEYETDLFDGEFIRSFYKCTPLNLGVDNTLKILLLLKNHKLLEFEAHFVHKFYNYLQMTLTRQILLNLMMLMHQH